MCLIAGRVWFINMKLKDYEHSYRCCGGGYEEYDSIDNFLSEWGDADFDYNLCFRWDILKKDEYSEEEYDDYYAEVFIVQQRKGMVFHTVIKKITEKDLSKLEEWLKPRFKHLKELWRPFT